MGVYGKLAYAVAEKNYWKDVCRRQRWILKGCKADQARAIVSVKQECEEILGDARYAAERNIRQLLRLYGHTSKKVNRLEKKLVTARNDRRMYERRAYELANLLETLQHFHVNRADALCRLTATALMDLTARGKSFEEDLTKLRELSSSNEKEREADLERRLLASQCPAFRQAIEKILHRKFQTSEVTVANVDGAAISKNSTGTPGEIPAKSSQESETNDRKNGVMEEARKDARPDARVRESVMQSISEENESMALDSKTSKACRKLPEKSNAARVESRSNGALFHEHVINFSENHRMKVKYSANTIDPAWPLTLALAAGEEGYEDASTDKVSTLSGNIYTVTKYPAARVDCGVQTARGRTSSRFTQTPSTTIEKFHRRNAPLTILNTEKRAIDRSLRNLEETVASLRRNALARARSITRSSEAKFLVNDDFSDCIRTLTR